MSIQAIGGSSDQTSATYGLTPTTTADGTAGTQNGKGDGAQGAGGASSSSSSSDVTSTTTTTNADGSITTVTTYGNGTTSTSTSAAVASAGGSRNLLDGSNGAQLSTLLKAQEQQSAGSQSQGQG